MLSHSAKIKKVSVKKEVANEKSMLFLNVPLSSLDVDHVDLRARAALKALWDAAGEVNSTHLVLNYRLHSETWLYSRLMLMYKGLTFIVEKVKERGKEYKSPDNKNIKKTT